MPEGMSTGGPTPEKHPSFDSVLKDGQYRRVDDAQTAEHMAYASAAEEVEVVENRRLALEHAAKVGDPDGYDHEEAAHDHAEAAEDARQAADDKAETTRQVYERVKDL